MMFYGPTGEGRDGKMVAQAPRVKVGETAGDLIERTEQYRARWRVRGFPKDGQFRTTNDGSALIG
jgi:hypothetical protein